MIENKEDFEKAFRLGLGRAYLYVREHGDEGLQDIILRHCLKNPCYDTQGEGSRATWLMSVIDLCKQPGIYNDKIIEALPKEDDDRDLLQLYDLCLILAERGDKQAKKEIYDRFDKQEFNEAWLGGDQIIALDGLDGLTHVAQILGQRMLKDPEYWDGMTYKYACELFTKEKVDVHLGILAKKDEAVAAYLKNSYEIYEMWNKPKDLESEENLRERKRKEISFEIIQSDIEKAFKVRGRFFSFGRYATDEEIKILYERMLKEERPEQLVRYLWIFRWRALPDIDDKLLSFCLSENDEVRYHAITALSNSIDKRVRDYAIREINLNQNYPLQIIELFTNSFQKGDSVYIERVLFRSGNLEENFSRAYDVLRIFEKNSFEEMLTCLVWVYENIPCAHCRCRAVELLADHNMLPDTIRDEIKYDCCDDTKKYAQ